VSSESETIDYLVVCEFCGFEIEERDQPCPALDDGRCRP